MKHISVLIPKGDVTLACIEGPTKLFTIVNAFLKQMGKKPAFEIHLVGLCRSPEHYSGSFSVMPEFGIAEVGHTDLIIIPPINGDKEETIALNSEFIPWIIQQYREGAEIASLCVGSFLFAATGLLNGKNCTTHWQSANDFRRLFPEVNLVEDRIITAESGLYTSGGANSFWNLLIHLVEKYTDREMAVLASKYFVIEIGSRSQSSFMMFKGEKTHEDEAVKKAQELIENNIQNRMTVSELSSKLAIGRRSLERRFKKATSNTVVEYMQRVKIEAAKVSLESSHENVNEVMYKVGYTDPKAFRVTFKKITSLSPLQYRNKYSREVRTMTAENKG